MKMKTITIFTPTYNRANTLGRTYKSLCYQTCKDFEWLIVDDGSTDNTSKLVEQWIVEADFVIRYIYKENGGLYTGYNTAYANIETELNVCIDSDDYMPNNAVEIIINHWRKYGSDKYAGIIGLDFYHNINKPIGGYFPNELKEVFLLDLTTKKIHFGDVKQVLRTDLIKSVAPLIGFPDEKNFNPYYLFIQICDDFPLLVLNENLCYVEYQQTGMSRNIINQYFNSPRSFAKSRIIEMGLKRSTLKFKIKSAIHYVAECFISNDKNWLKKSPEKLITLLVFPIGLLLYLYLRFKYKALNDT